MTCAICGLAILAAAAAMDELSRSLGLFLHMFTHMTSSSNSRNFFTTDQIFTKNCSLLFLLSRGFLPFNYLNLVFVS